VLARLLAVALAVVGAVVAIQALRSNHDCARLHAEVRGAPVARLGGLARSTTDRCGAASDRAVVLVTLITRHRPRLAVEVARDMTRSSPDDYNGWLALWQLTHSRAALARAHALNPIGTPTPR
jgi:hypothetical protein